MDSTIDSDQFLVASSQTVVIEGTTLLDSFELERKLKGATGGISAGHIVVLVTLRFHKRGWEKNILMVKISL